jgi:hypothetical protein
MRIITRHELGFTRWEFLGIIFILVIMVALAIPRFVRPRTTVALGACLNNLRLIDLAKFQWAREKGKGPDEIPAAGDIRPYLGRGTAGMLPTCPMDTNNSFTSSYSINSVAAKPTCKIWPSIHVLPYQERQVRRRIEEAKQ